MTIEIFVSRQEVMDAVGVATAYTGAKLEETMQPDEKAMDRIATTEENEDCLGRFWDECASAATASLKFLSPVVDATTDDYRAAVCEPSNFDPSVAGVMNGHFKSFFILGICARWFAMSNKAEEEKTAREAAAALTQGCALAFARRAPRRPRIGVTDTGAVTPFPSSYPRRSRTPR